MTIDELLKRRLVFVVGKGGVGKSTIAASLGLFAARSGKKVCLVESDSQEQMSSLFKTAPVGFIGRTLAPNIRGISISTDKALQDFANRRLPLHKISKHLISNRLIRYFLDATPGLKELLILIVINNLIQENKDELFIVDMPATGHGLAMLNVPEIVMNAVHAGPLRRYAEEVYNTINDSNTSAVCFVTLAEELAATETVELYGTIRDTLKIFLGPVIANATHSAIFTKAELKNYEQLKKDWSKNDDTMTLLNGAELEIARTKLNEHYIIFLKETLGINPVVIPFLFNETVDLDALVLISEKLHRGTDL